MLIQAHRFYLLFFANTFLAVHNSALPQRYKPLGPDAGKNLAPTRLDRSGIRIDVLADTEREGEDEDWTRPTKPLRKRALVAAGLAVSAIVLNNLGNMEPALTALGDIAGEAVGLMPDLFGRGKKLPNGGLAYSDGTIKWSGQIIEFEYENVHVFVISPQPKCPQTICIKGRRVFVNSQHATQDFRSFEAPEYRKCPDKSLWYTNITLNPSCTRMTAEEIEEFNKLQQEIEMARDKAVKGLLNKAYHYTAKGARRAFKTSSVLTVKAARGIDEGGKVFAKSTKKAFIESGNAAANFLDDASSVASKVAKEWDEQSREFAAATAGCFGSFGQTFRRSFKRRLGSILGDPAKLEDANTVDSRGRGNLPPRKEKDNTVPVANRIDSWFNGQNQAVDDFVTIRNNLNDNSFKTASNISNFKRLESATQDCKRARKEDTTTKQDKTQEPRTQAHKSPEPKRPERRSPEPKRPERRSPEPKRRERKILEPRSPEPKTREPKIPEPTTREPKSREPKTRESESRESESQEPTTRETKSPEPKTRESESPESESQEPTTREPKSPEPKTQESESPVSESQEPLNNSFFRK